MNRRVALALAVIMGVYAGAVCLVMAGRVYQVQLDPTRQEPLDTTFICLWAHAPFALGAVLAALVLRRRRGCTARVPRLMTLAACVLLVVSADTLLGLAYAPPVQAHSIYEVHPSRGWSHQPGAEAYVASQLVRINRAGFRGADVAARRAAGARRIVFAGDSLTFGYDVRDDQTFAARTARLLKARGDAVEVINAGVCGYAGWQEIDLLREALPRWSPDLLVMQFCFNDVTDLLNVAPGEVHTRSDEFEFSNARLHPSGIVRFVSGVYDDYRLGRYYRLKTVDRERPPHDAILHPQPPADLERAWGRALDDLAAIDDDCRARGLPWLLVVFPLEGQCFSSGADTRPQEKILAWARQRKVAYLDLLPVYAREMASGPDGPRPTLFLSLIHPNADGHRVAAEAIVAALDELRWLSSRPGGG